MFFMSGADRQPVEQPPGGSVLARDLVIEGRIDGVGDVRLAGQFKGSVTVKGNLVVDREAHVKGDLTADTVSVAGTLEGRITARSTVDLLASGTVVGQVTARTFQVESGARMRGDVDFGR